MSFAKQAAQLLTDPYEMRKFAQEVENDIDSLDLEPGAQDLMLSDRELEDAEDDVRRRRRRSWAILGALGGIGALGLGGYYGWKNRGAISSGLGLRDKLTISDDPSDPSLGWRKRLGTATRESLGLSSWNPFSGREPHSLTSRLPFIGPAADALMSGQAVLRTYLREGDGARHLDRVLGPTTVDRYIRRRPGSLDAARRILGESDTKALRKEVSDTRDRMRQTPDGLLGRLGRLGRFLTGEPGLEDDIVDAPLRMQDAASQANMRSQMRGILNDAVNPERSVVDPGGRSNVRGTQREAAGVLRELVPELTTEVGGEDMRRAIIREVEALNEAGREIEAQVSAINEDFDTRIRDAQARLDAVSTGNRAKRGEGATRRAIIQEINDLTEQKSEAVREVRNRPENRQVLNRRQALARALGSTEAPESISQALSSFTDILSETSDARTRPGSEPRSRWQQHGRNTMRATRRGVLPMLADRIFNIPMRMFSSSAGGDETRAQQLQRWEEAVRQQGGAE